MGTHSPAAARTIIEARSRNALSALRLPHMSRLSRYVHPTRGLRFSPYVSADASDRVFSRNQVRYLGNSSQGYHWGSFDGTGDDILLTWRNYYRRNAETGIWHETYLVRAGEYEAIYGHMPEFGLGRAGRTVPLGAPSSARHRLGRATRTPVAT